MEVGSWQKKYGKLRFKVQNRRVAINLKKNSGEGVRGGEEGMGTAMKSALCFYKPSLMIRLRTFTFLPRILI